MNEQFLQSISNQNQKNVYLYLLKNENHFASLDRFKKGEKLASSEVEKMITFIAPETKKVSKNV